MPGLLITRSAPMQLWPSGCKRTGGDVLYWNPQLLRIVATHMPTARSHTAEGEEGLWPGTPAICCKGLAKEASAPTFMIIGFKP